MKSTASSIFVSRLQPLSTLQLERMSPMRLQRREAEEAQGSARHEPNIFSASSA